MAREHPEGWSIGDKVCVVVTLNVRAENVRPFMATITKVGRRWITAGDGYMEIRFDAQTRQIDGNGYTSPGKVWASEAEYHETTEVAEVWQEFRQKLPYTAPDHMTLSDIYEIIEAIHPAGQPCTDRR